GNGRLSANCANPEFGGQAACGADRIGSGGRSEARIPFSASARRRKSVSEVRRPRQNPVEAVSASITMRSYLLRYLWPVRRRKPLLVIWRRPAGPVAIPKAP